MDKTTKKAVELKMPETTESSDLRRSEGYETNPFICQLKEHMYLQPKPNIIVAKGEQIVDVTTGEIIEDSVLYGRRKVVDRTQFAKIYFTEVGSILGLSQKAIKVMLYISQKMDFNTMVIINAKKECTKIGYKSQQSIQQGIKELISFGILAKTNISSAYWVNPLYICKGERFAIYNEYTTQEYNQKSEQRRKEVQEKLRQQAEEKQNSLDEHTQRSLEAMNKRAEEEYIAEQNR